MNLYRIYNKRKNLSLNDSYKLISAVTKINIDIFVTGMLKESSLVLSLMILV